MMSWVYYAIVGAIALTVQIIMLTKLPKLGFSITLVNAIVFTAAGIMMTIVHFCSKESTLSLSSLWKLEYGLLFLITAIAIFFVNHFTIKALKLSPNPGYVIAIQNISTVLVTLISVVMLNAELSSLKSLGIVFVVIGVCLLSLF